jgi:hypothetical protein
VIQKSMVDPRRANDNKFPPLGAPAPAKPLHQLHVTEPQQPSNTLTPLPRSTGTGVGTTDVANTTLTRTPPRTNDEMSVAVPKKVRKADRSCVRCKVPRCKGHGDRSKCTGVCCVCRERGCKGRGRARDKECPFLINRRKLALPSV